MSLLHAQLRRRATALALALALALATQAVGLPTLAADSPEAAVNELVATVASGDFSSLDQVVCEAQRDALLAQFDPAVALGLPAGSEAHAGALAFKLEDTSVEVIDEQEESAAARLTGTLRLALDEAQARELVRLMVAVDGEQIEDEELDVMVPLMLEALSEAQAIDFELTLVQDEGEWLVCGGLDAGDPDPALVEQSISFDGICGLVPLAEVNAVGPAELAYDSSYGAEDFCAYASNSYEAYYSVSLSLGRDEGLDLYESFYPEGTTLTVAGRPAFQSGDQLFIQLDEGVLLIDIVPGDAAPADFDSVTYGSRLAELFIPHMSELEVSDVADADVAGPSLCDAMSSAELTDLSGLVFDDAAGDDGYCDYTGSSEEAGFYVVTTSLDPSSLDDLRSIFPEGQELTVAGLPAYAESDQLWVALGASPISFGVSLYFEDVSAADGLERVELMQSIAATAIPAVLGAADPGS